jgi:hypothetical protein
MPILSAADLLGISSLGYRNGFDPTVPLFRQNTHRIDNDFGYRLDVKRSRRHRGAAQRNNFF